MNMEDVIEKIIEMIEDNIDRTYDFELNGEISLFGDLELDSLEMVLLFDDFEQEYGFSVDMEELKTFSTIENDMLIKDVANYVCSKVND